MDFTTLSKNLKKDFSHLKPIKVAVLGDSATQFLVQALRGTGYEFGFDLQVFEAEFNQIDRQILDPDSELYAFNAEVVLIFESTHKLLQKYNKKMVLLGIVWKVVILRHGKIYGKSDIRGDTFASEYSMRSIGSCHR
ncbi:hypothetical protein AGMMS4957_14170 [Bacteroidia bacterium]|nr:hypothetical protein AGMMS4957_14170 [Bacteroidia bacterium]